MDSDPEQLHGQRLIQGISWTYSGAALVMAAQVAYTALTARLINPAGFGAYASAQALIALSGYFTFTSVGSAITRMREVGRDVVATGIALVLIASLSFAIVIAVLAPLWSRLWDAEGATSLLRLFAPSIVISGAAVVPLGLARRNLRFKAAAMAETLGPLSGFAVGAVLAWRLRSPSALVVGQIASATVILIVAVTLSRRELAVGFTRRAARELWGFAGQVSGQNLGYYLIHSLPLLAVGRTSGVASLGAFSRGNMLVSLPLTFLVGGITKTSYPIISRLQDQPERLRSALEDLTVSTTAFVFPAFAALAGASSIVVSVLLGPQWHEASTLVLPLSCFAAANFAYAVLANATESLGQLRIGWYLEIVWIPAIIIGLVLAVSTDTPSLSIAIAMAGAQLVIHLVQLALMHRASIVSAPRVVFGELANLLVAVGWFGVIRTTALALDAKGAFLQLFALLGVGLALALVTALGLRWLPAGRALARRGDALGPLARLLMIRPLIAEP